MGIYIGNIEAKVDDKGRIAVPAQYRRHMNDRGIGVHLVMRVDGENMCLVMYPIDVWQKKVEQLQQSLNEWDAEDQMMLMQYVASAAEAEIDAQGRVLIPRKILQQIAVESDGLFVGGVDRFALWSKEKFEAKMMDGKDFGKRLMGKIINKD